jgi:hypothetical protein
MKNEELFSRHSSCNRSGAQAPLFFERCQVVEFGCRFKPSGKLHDSVL